MSFPRHTLAEADALVSAAGFTSTTVTAAERCIDCRRLTRRTIVGGPFYCSAPAHVRRAIEVATAGQRIMTDRAAALDAMPTEEEPADPAAGMLPADAPAVDPLFEGVTAAGRAHLVHLAIARAANMYLVEVTGEGVVASYPQPERADEVAESYRAAGQGASVLRPCGHGWNRYAPAVECPSCSSLRSLESLERVGGHLNPASRARLDGHRHLLRQLDVIDAELAAPTATPAPTYGCVQHIERGPSCGPDCDALTHAWNAPQVQAPAPVPSIPSEATVATARGHAATSAGGLVPVEVELDAAAAAAVSEGTLGAVSVAEPEVHLMSGDLLDACGTATHGAGLSLAPSTTPEHITCPRCRELASQEREAAQELLADLSLELGGETVDRNPVDVLQELRLGVRTNREVDTPRPARHLAAVLRGTLRQAVSAREVEEGNGERRLEARYEDVRGVDRPRVVRAGVTAAVRLLRDAGLVTVYRHPHGEWSTVNATEAGDRMLDELPFLGSPAAVLDRQ